MLWPNEDESPFPATLFQILIEGPSLFGQTKLYHPRDNPGRAGDGQSGTVQTTVARASCLANWLWHLPAPGLRVPRFDFAEFGAFGGWEGEPSMRERAKHEAEGEA